MKYEHRAGIMLRHKAYRKKSDSTLRTQPIQLPSCV
jgi:hypothetical protein